MLKEKAQIMDGEKLVRTIVRISHEIAEHNVSLESVILVGIKTRGMPFAKRVKENLKKFYSVDVETAELDITLYRDDLSELSEFPKVSKTKMPVAVSGKNVVLCDDVIFTGRTARAAIDAILSNGRPKTIQLAVVVDRGHREFPIKPDYIGKNIPTSMQEVVSVKFWETDGDDKVEILEKL